MFKKVVNKKHILLTVLFAVYTSEYMLSLIRMDIGAYGLGWIGEALHYLKMPALAIGFILFPLSRRLGGDMRARLLLFFGANVVYITGMALISSPLSMPSLPTYVASYLVSLVALGFLGGAVYYYVAIGFASHLYAGRLLGIGGASAFLVQMAAQYLVSEEAILLCLLLVGFLFTIFVTLTSGDSFEWMFDEPLEYASEGGRLPAKPASTSRWRGCHGTALHDMRHD